MPLMACVPQIINGFPEMSTPSHQWYLVHILSPQKAIYNGKSHNIIQYTLPHEHTMGQDTDAGTCYSVAITPLS